MEIDRAFPLHKAERHTSWAIEPNGVVIEPIVRDVPRVEARNAAGEVGDADHDTLEHAPFARPVGVEQRDLSEPRIPTNQRERVGALDLVHTAHLNDRQRKVGSFGHPEGNVIEGVRTHTGTVPILAGFEFIATPPDEPFLAPLGRVRSEAAHPVPPLLRPAARNEPHG